MEKTFYNVALAWLVPGLGHFILGSWLRGALLCGIFILLTILGIMLGGLYYPGNPTEFGIMYWLHQLASAGNGIYPILNLLLKGDNQSAAATEAFRSAYFEYGGRCLALAGLLNYLAILDVFDISLKRKS